MDINAVLKLTAAEIQHILTSGQASCMDVIQSYLSQIDKHNHDGMRLNALIQIAPYEWLQEQAAVSDRERKAGKIRGPLHGVPVIVKVIPPRFICSDRLAKGADIRSKDNICTPSCGMNTTLGSLAFKDCKGSIDGIGVRRLQAAGSIILGKANLSAS